jgi:hypothetical protein
MTGDAGHGSTVSGRCPRDRTTQESLRCLPVSLRTPNGAGGAPIQGQPLDAEHPQLPLSGAMLSSSLPGLPNTACR